MVRTKKRIPSNKQRRKKFQLELQVEQELPADVPSTSEFDEVLSADVDEVGPTSPPWIELPGDLTANKQRRKKFQLESQVEQELPPDVPSTSEFDEVLSSDVDEVGSPSPPWIELPRDLTANILKRLGTIQILNSAQKVCTTWRSVCRDPFMWRVIDMRKINCTVGEYRVFLPDDVNRMCGYAVGLSQGGLIDIKIGYFCTDELLEYISDQSSQLKRFRLTCRGDEISRHVLEAALKKFSNLEELDLFFLRQPMHGLDIETIGRACPMLKSFTFNNNNRHCWFPSNYSDWHQFGSIDNEDNKDALAVAQTMPNLHHLGFFGNNISNEGLEAILVGCPLLESLDIRHCFGVDLSGDLGKRCLRQIRDFKYPDASMDDCEFDDTIYDDYEHSNSSGDCYSAHGDDCYSDPGYYGYYDDALDADDFCVV